MQNAKRCRARAAADPSPMAATLFGVTIHLRLQVSKLLKRHRKLRIAHIGNAAKTKAVIGVRPNGLKIFGERLRGQISAE